MYKGIQEIQNYDQFHVPLLTVKREEELYYHSSLMLQSLCLAIDTNCHAELRYIFDIFDISHRQYLNINIYIILIYKLIIKKELKVGLATHARPRVPATKSRKVNA